MKNPTKCIVPSCCNSKGKNKNRTVFRFPSSDYHSKALKRLESWCCALNIKSEIIPNLKSVGVCSRHFKPEDITYTHFKTRLSWYAIPELFLNETTEMGNTNTTSKVIEISDSENEEEKPTQPTETATDKTLQNDIEKSTVETEDSKIVSDPPPPNDEDKYKIIIDSDEDHDVRDKEDNDNEESSKTYYQPEFINIELLNKIEPIVTAPEPIPETVNIDNDKNKTEKLVEPIRVIELFDDIMETDDIKDDNQVDPKSNVTPIVTTDSKFVETEIIDLDKPDTIESVEPTKDTIASFINKRITNLYRVSNDENLDKTNVEQLSNKGIVVKQKDDSSSIETTPMKETDTNQMFKNEISIELVSVIVPNKTVIDGLANFKNIAGDKTNVEIIDLDDSGDSETIADDVKQPNDIVNKSILDELVSDLNIDIIDNDSCETPDDGNNVTMTGGPILDKITEGDGEKFQNNIFITKESDTSNVQPKDSNAETPNSQVDLNNENTQIYLYSSEKEEIIDLDANEHEESDVLPHSDSKTLSEYKTDDKPILDLMETITESTEKTSSDAVEEKQEEIDEIICLDGNDIDDQKESEKLTDSKIDDPKESENEKCDINQEVKDIENVNQSTQMEMEINDQNEIGAVVDVELDNNEEVASITTAEANSKPDSVIGENTDIEMEVELEEHQKGSNEIDNNNIQVAANNEIEMELEETVNDIAGTKMDVDSVVTNSAPECVNYHCSKTTSVTSPAPIFVLSFYRINKKSNKRQFVCEKCYDDCVEQYEQMTGDLIACKPIIYKQKAQPDLIELSDSDDDDTTGSKRKNSSYNKNQSFIENNENNRNVLGNLEELIEKAFSQINIDMQLKKRTDIINKTIQSNEATSTALFNDIRELQKSADKMHYTLYQKYPNRIIKELPPIDLNIEDKLNLPPIGDISYPQIQTGNKYLAPRHAISGAWVECEALEVCPVHPTDPRKNGTYCKVMFCRRATKLVLSIKHIAYSEPPDVRLNVGTRVVAIFQQVPVPKQSFFPGTVGETLMESNKYRYLIFFDDGYCQYVKHEHVRLICEVSSNVWEDIDGNPGTSRFIQEFLSQFHNRISRPMLLAKRGQKIVTEFNGIWKLSKVVDVDCNLIKMYIEKNQTFEWIYRGSSRFAPIFKHRQIGNDLQLSAINYHLKKRNEPYIEMTLDEISDTNYQGAEANRVAEMQTDPKGLGQPPANRAVARKSTNQGSRNGTNNNNGTVNKAPVSLNNSVIVVDDDKMPKGKVTYYETTKRYSTTNYVAHSCSPACLVRVEDNLEPFNPIARPLLSGWERQICKYKSRKIAIYRAPCGRRLRTMLEVHRYLRLTDSPLNVECFDYDTTMHCLAEYTDLPQYIRNTDLSDGTEKMPISCCNYFDKTTPPTCTYSTNRIPTEGVNLNLDPNFLCACDCEDDCIDKSKCQCWQLTIKGARSINSSSPVDDIGYCFKRLLNPVPTGIYECNSRCKCKQNCLNRVVQHPLSVKLQVFKTTNRGWGLRTLHDIPKGSFICIYAGDLLTEQSSNELGAKEGDEYFAELDYIEAVEGLKEGYESDIPREEGDDEPEGEKDDDFENSADSDDDDFTSKCKAIDKKITTRSSTRSAKTQDKKSTSASRPPLTAVVTTPSPEDEDCITISDDEEVRAPVNFIPNTSYDDDTEVDSKYKSVRKLFGKDELGYVMDAKRNGNIGRYFNHSCNPNLFVQNVFVDTHDLRFPWVTFFSNTSIQAGTELTWNYNYDVGCVPGKVLYCQCDSSNCRGRLL